MKKLSLFLLMFAFAFCGCSNENDEVKNEGKEVIVSFEDLLTEAETEFKTEDGEKDNPADYYYKSNFKDSKSLIKFLHWYGDLGFGGGFTYTNKTDVTTPGYTNNSAITGKGKNGKVYLTSHTNSFTKAQLTNLHSDKYRFKGAWVTNSTYAYLAIKNQDDAGVGAVKEFAEGDWFKLTVIGYKADGTEIGKAEHYLADYRDGKRKIVNTWEWFDWSALEEAEYIEFELSSTDNGEYGMNTPAYFSIDAITIEEK
ncbi:DUF4465 domain-containing protein [uncultured Bacteroides sp.]|uniref:DUF4465 domain-containing protein n=1 Tax=uncultured Bacteroides sp. TaxID=162156 RepID=UPI0025DAC1BB|nr:DUF4465 domain-containing protein [uncultured Bacteroides sp.]